MGQRNCLQRYRYEYKTFILRAYRSFFLDKVFRMSYGQDAAFGYPAGVTVADLAAPQIKHLIKPHWNNYPPVNPMWHYLLGVIYIVLGTASFLGNGVVIYLFLKVKKLRTPSNLLITNLAILDFNMLLSNFPIFAWNSFNGGLWSSSPTTVTTSSSMEFLEHPLPSARPGPWLSSSGLMAAPVLVRLSSDGATTSLKASSTPAALTTWPRTSTTRASVPSSLCGATLFLCPASSTSTSSSSSLSLLTNLL